MVQPPTPAKRRRKYVPAVGPRLKTLLAFVFALFALLAINALYLGTITLLEWFTSETYQNYFYQLMFLGHLVLGARAGHVARARVRRACTSANTRGRPNRRAVRVGYLLFFAALVLLFTGFVLTRIEGFEVTDPRVRGVAYWAHVIAPLACGVAVRPAPARGPEDPLGRRRALGRRGRRLRSVDGRAAPPGSARLEPGRSRVGRAVLLPVAGAHLDGGLHPRARAHERRVLRRVSPDRARGLGELGAPLQLVQQPSLPRLDPRDARRAHGARRQRPGRALLCRLPRPRAVLQWRVRRSELRRRQRPHGRRRDHLHGLPRDHARQQPARQRRLHDRGARALSVRLQREPGARLDQPTARQGQARVPQEDLPQAAAQDARVLRWVPQGAPARRAQRVQVAARAEPLRLVPALGRLGARGAELLLPARGRGELQRLPHAADRRRRVRRAARSGDR